jgi:glycosyltransferase involved in cell wall biosynthesis
MGWHWAVEIARLGHEVHVLTRAVNVAANERRLAEFEGLQLHIHGYDLPRWASWWKKGHRGIHLYYVLWQWWAYREAKKLHAQEHFDLVHHITFGVHRHPSFMGRLGVPFILGPLGGGECSPPVLLRSAPWRARMYESLRSFGNHIAAIDPLARSTFHRAALIFCKTPETLAVIPVQERKKCSCLLEVAVDPAQLAQLPSIGSERAQFLFAGSLIQLKGIHLILHALRQVRHSIPDARLTIVGDGRDRDWPQTISRNLGVDDSVEWRGWIPRNKLIKLCGQNTAFVFPSLHDSSGNVVIEALS